jgi:hypothetical protein
MAEQTISSPFVLTLLCEKSPIDRNSSWISDDRFEIAPNQKEKKDMKNYKKDYKWTRFAHNKILENEDKIVD